MDTPSPSIQSLARRLAEASHADSDQHLHEAARVTARLGISLTKFAGGTGYSSLLRRALALATVDVPALKCVTVGPDGRLEGLKQLADGPGEGHEAAVAITARLLGLLVLFIGERLTLKLVRDAWPDLSPAEINEIRGR